MSSRQGIRPRHFENIRNLLVVGDAKALEYTDSDIKHILQLVGQPEQQLRPKGREQIPIPEVLEIPTYKTDYLPICKMPFTYLKEGSQNFKEIVEYDLDENDEKWLETFNEGKSVLSKQNFEKILQVLEVSNAEATDQVITLAGAQQAEKMTLAACNSIEHMSYDQAITKLQETTGIHIDILDSCYKYWRDKRLKQETPLMRKYQCPPSANDPNPFNVFRARERINKPLTRRRRENNIEFMEKLKMIHSNIKHSLDLALKVVEREQLKYYQMLSNIVVQKFEIGQYHDQQIVPDQAYQIQVKDILNRKGAVGKDLERLIRDSKQPYNNSIFSTQQKIRDTVMTDREDIVQKLDAPPLPLQRPMLFTRQIKIKQLKQKLLEDYKMKIPDNIDLEKVVARVGRGGRIILEQSDQQQIQYKERRLNDKDQQKRALSLDQDNKQPSTQLQLVQDTEWPPRSWLQVDFKMNQTSYA